MKIRLLMFLTLSFFVTNLHAQGKYSALSARANQPSLHFDNILIPHPENNEVTYALTFRFGYDFLPFKKINPGQDIKAPEGKSFYTTARLSTEIFAGSKKQRDLANLQSVALETWSDTVYASDFEETQSNKYFESGALVTKLKPGKYNYILQLSAGGEANDRNSDRREITIPDFSKKQKGEVYLIQSVNRKENNTKARLINMGNNVPFGKDFYALIRIPGFETNKSFSVLIESVRANKNDTTVKEQKFELDIPAETVFKNTILSLTGENKTILELQDHPNGYTYSLIKIPNSELENDAYQIKVLDEQTDQVVAQKVFRSFWADMPPSLYSLDFSIDMLKFIVSEEEFDEIKNGSRNEKEKKFREFWKSKDPTPKTVYNELMAEYYRRIDYAYNNFSSMQVPGYQNDQGEIYIKYGPPNSVDRTFPQNGPAREIWDYGNRKFIFEATSGFGDFVLVSTSS